MKTSVNMLETKVFYRLVKVIHIVLLGSLLLGVLLFGWQLRPYRIINADKSYVTCPDGTSYTFKSLGFGFYSQKSIWKESDVNKAIKVCNNHLKPIPGYVDSHLDWEVVDGEHYPTHWESKTIGSWHEPIKFWLIGFVISFIFLNLIKKAVLYVVYGIKFTVGLRKQ